jgi:hypothetical protein
MSKRREPLPPAKAPLPTRAKEAMGVWFKSLNRSDRAKLAFQGSRWGRQGGSMIAPNRRPTRAYRKREELRRERETRYRAEIRCLRNALRPAASDQEPKRKLSCSGGTASLSNIAGRPVEPPPWDHDRGGTPRRMASAIKGLRELL